VRALVTGNLGFLGVHFADALDRRGWEVFGYDVKAGLHEDCRHLFRTGSEYVDAFDLVVHCAGIVGGRARIDGHPLDLAENLELDSLLFRWASRTRPKRVVYVSSSAVYPVHLQTAAAQRERSNGWLSESDLDITRWREPFGPPDQTYGWSKLVGEHLATQLRQDGVPVTVVRPFSGYGRLQDETYPFRAFIERARRRDDPFEIWGDGKQVRDFVHVDDIVEATLVAAASGVDGPLNICTGVGTSFNRLAALICDAVGYSPKFFWRADQPQGVRYRVGDPSELFKVRRPIITLEEGIWEGLLR
jgi:nucleoside-diphosphate-sugar epimerase